MSSNYRLTSKNCLPDRYTRRRYNLKVISLKFVTLVAGCVLCQVKDKFRLLPRNGPIIGGQLKLRRLGRGLMISYLLRKPLFISSRSTAPQEESIISLLLLGQLRDKANNDFLGDQCENGITVRPVGNGGATSAFAPPNGLRKSASRAYKQTLTSYFFDIQICQPPNNSMQCFNSQ